MRKNGVAPKVTQPPGAPPRITQEADGEWLKFCDNLTGEKAAEAAQIAAARRERAVKAAARAVKSPTHISNKHRSAGEAA
jgi:hypothetical protein